MIFWDTSAVVPLLVREPHTDRALELLGRDGDMVTWWGTTVECWSALARRTREHALSEADRRQAEALLDRLAASCFEIVASDEVRGHARRLLRRHSLRAGDALQLAAALVWADGRPEGHAFACLDARLFEAADREGFVDPFSS